MSPRNATGLLRGRPGPTRATRNSANNGGSAGESPALPGVIAITNGRPVPSTSM